jgi:hypothetical protein
LSLQDGNRQMEEFVARENIRRFRNQLLVVEDDAERKLLLQLLSVEEQKLEEIGVRRVCRRPGH